MHQNVSNTAKLENADGDQCVCRYKRCCSHPECHKWWLRGIISPYFALCAHSASKCTFRWLHVRVSKSVLAGTLKLTKLSDATTTDFDGWQPNIRDTFRRERHLALKRNTEGQIFTVGLSLVFLSFCLLLLTPSTSSPVFHRCEVYTTTANPPPHCSLTDFSRGQNLAVSSHRGQSQSRCVSCDWRCSWVCVCTSWHENCSTVCVLLFTGRPDGAEETIYICLALNFLFQSIWLGAMRDFHRCTKTSALHTHTRAHARAHAQIHSVRASISVELSGRPVQ